MVKLVIPNGREYGSVERHIAKMVRIIQLIIIISA